jgi:hypothetical protein
MSFLFKDAIDEFFAFQVTHIPDNNNIYIYIYIKEEEGS